MAEPRKKSRSILLNADGRKVFLELFDATLWPKRSSTEGLWRVRMDGKWHCPEGKWSFLTAVAVAELVSDIIAGDMPCLEEERPRLHMRQRVKVLYGECVGGLPLQERYACGQSPPWRGADGRWHVFVSFQDGYIRPVPCHDVEPRLNRVQQQEQV